MAKTPQQQSRTSKAGLAVGIGLIAFGCVSMVAKGHGPEWLRPFMWTALQVLDLVWPIALMVMGGVLLWAGLTGRLDGALSGRFNPPLRRAHADARLLGVCGGIAHFFAIDGVLVRVVFVLFLFVQPLFCLVLYAVLAVLMPRS